MSIKNVLSLQTFKYFPFLVSRNRCCHSSPFTFSWAGPWSSSSKGAVGYGFVLSSHSRSFSWLHARCHTGYPSGSCQRQSVFPISQPKEVARSPFALSSTSPSACFSFEWTPAESSSDSCSCAPSCYLKGGMPLSFWRRTWGWKFSLTSRVSNSSLWRLCR